MILGSARHCFEMNPNQDPDAISFRFQSPDPDWTKPKWFENRNATWTQIRIKMIEKLWSKLTETNIRTKPAKNLQKSRTITETIKQSWKPYIT